MDAAEFQRRHNLEGAPDPFPSLNDPTPRKSKAAAANTQAPSADSEEAFPSLAPAARPTQTNTWAPRIARQATPVVPQVTESFTLGAIDLSAAGKDGKPATLGEVIKGVLAKHKGIKIEASSNQRARQTTFNLKAENRKELEKAKRALLAGLSPTVTLTVNAPQSTIPSIIGPKGANLKEIRDKINVRIDIPRRDLAPGNGHANGNARSGAATPVDEDEEEPTIPISVTGAQPLAEEAADILRSIIASKTAKTTQRVRDIPAHIVPFVKARRGAYVQAAGGADVQLQLNSAEREFSATGDREGVARVIEAVKNVVAQTQAQITSVKIQLPKRQHRLLVGKAVDEIMTESHCSVTVPSPEDSNEEVTVYGRAEEVGNGLTAVMAKANSQYIHEFPLPGPIALSRQLLTYIVRTGYTKTLQASHPGVTVFTPSLKSTAATLNIDLVGEKAAVDGAVRQVSGLMGKMIGAVKEVQADWLVHKLIQAKHAKKIKAFHDTNNVLLVFPPESEETSAILLVYDPTSPNASPSPVEKAKQLEDVEKEVTKWVRDAADVKTIEVPVERKWHDAVTGPNGTTLNALIGEERALSIKVGGESGHDDVIIVRGASGDVDRAVKEIQTIVKDAEEDKILSGYSVEFEIDREYVARIVGAQGSAVNKLRDTLGVKVDFDDGDDSKKKKSVKTHTKITGRKENVEEAKRRILAQVEKFADEAQETLKIPVQYHAGLIGEKGKYVIRLEEKYGVKITFPRESGEAGEGGRTRETLKADEVLIKGGRKGVSHAKSELLDAVEFEKENNNVAKFSVPSKAIPRILGKAGATINEIKDESGAIIDLDKSEEASGSVTISLRGSKTAIATAKKAIQAIAEQAADEISVTLPIEARFHRTLIGPGGSGLKDLIARCGGPTEPRAQAGLLRFPRQGEEPSDEVRLRGDKKIVEKLRAEIEKIVGELKDRVTVGVAIPNSAHRALIGRGGRNLTDFQSKYGVQVQYPGSHGYNAAGKIENEDELADVPREDLVKISGPRANIEKAIEDLKANAKPAAPEGVSDTVTIELKYHHAISQQGNLFRSLRTFGVHLDESTRPTKSAVPPRPTNGSVAPAARIDDTEEAAPGIQWETAENYADAEEGEAVWTIKARDEAGLERAKKMIKEAQAKAERMTHVGFLTLPDRTSFPRIVGSKGANIARMHGETGADITVGRDDNTIVIMGTETAIEEAKEAILKIVNDSATGAPRGERRGGRGRGRGVDRDRDY